MMDYTEQFIVSKFKRSKLIWAGSLIALFSLGLVFEYRSMSLLLEKFSIEGFLFVILFFFLNSLIIFAFKDFKKFRIDEEGKEIKFYSIFFPFGKTIKLKDFKFKMDHLEMDFEGEHRVVYLVNKEGYAIFKINGQFYKNYELLYDTIELDVIDYKLNIGIYFRLLFFGKVKITQINKQKKDDDRKKIDFRKFFSIVFSIVITLFVLSYLIKMIASLFGNK